MNAKPNSTSSSAETTLRERASVLRSASARKSPAASLEECLAEGRSFAKEFDFAAFSTREIARLYEVTRQVDECWSQIRNFPFCTEIGSCGFMALTNVGRFVEAEENRIGIFADRCVAEIARRTPVDDDERDEILCVRIRHELNCSGRVDRQDAPDLLIEALKAWG